MQREWSRLDASYSVRVAHLRFGGGLSGSVRLDATAVADDTSPDVLIGGSGQNWLIDSL